MLNLRTPDKATMEVSHPKKSRRKIDSISLFLAQAAAWHGSKRAFGTHSRVV